MKILDIIDNNKLEKFFIKCEWNVEDGVKLSPNYTRRGKMAPPNIFKLLWNIYLEKKI